MFKATKRKMEPGANKMVEHLIQSVVDPGFHTGGRGHKNHILWKTKVREQRKKSHYNSLKTPFKLEINLQIDPCEVIKKIID